MLHLIFFLNFFPEAIRVRQIKKEDDMVQSSMLLEIGIFS